MRTTTLVIAVLFGTIISTAILLLEETADAANCTLDVSAPNNLCYGADVAVSCGNCNYSGQAGYAWQNMTTRGSVPGAGNVTYTSVDCYSYTPCNATIMTMKDCSEATGICYLTAETDCTARMAGMAVMRKYVNAQAVQCVEGS